MKDIEKIKNTALNSISDYCINDCHAYCCRKGYLIISSEEVDLIAGDKKETLIKNNSLKELLDGKFSLNFENSFSGCPALKDFKCSIHSNPKRPNTCKDFPIFILNKKIKISNRCPAKKENKFFKFEKDAKELGYEFVEEFFE